MYSSAAKSKKIVSCEAMRGWWNRGLHEKSLGTFHFLVKDRIPEHLSGLALVSSWQDNISDMLRSIPTVSAEGTIAYFDTIDSKLTYYAKLLNKARDSYPEQLGLDFGIVLNILSFL